MGLCYVTSGRTARVFPHVDSRELGVTLFKQQYPDLPVESVTFRHTHQSLNGYATWCDKSRWTATIHNDRCGFCGVLVTMLDKADTM